MKSIIVVAALIENNGLVLLAKRSTGDPNVLGKWEFSLKVKEYDQSIFND